MKKVQLGTAKRKRCKYSKSESTDIIQFANPRSPSRPPKPIRIFRPANRQIKISGKTADCKLAGTVGFKNAGIFCVAKIGKQPRVRRIFWVIFQQSCGKMELWGYAMAEALMQMYETMTATAQQELYDFALFLISKQQTKRTSQKTPAEKFLEIASKIHGNSNGQKWSRDELYER